MAGGNVSLLQFGEGGTILSDAIVIFRTPRFVIDNYGGKAAQSSTMLRVQMDETGEDGADVEHVQLFSVGGGTSNFVPSEDGLGLDKVGDKSVITKTSNFAVLMQSIMDAGFPPERFIDNDISWLDGIKCHVTRKAVTRDGMADQKKDATVLVVDKLYLDEKPGKAKAGAKGGGKAAAAAVKEVDADLVEEAKTILLEVLYSTDDQSIAKNKLMPPVLGVTKDNPNKRELIKIIVSDAFLSLCDGWKYEGGVISAG